MLYAKKNIYIGYRSKLHDVLMIASSIILDENFKGDIQAFASDSIIVKNKWPLETAYRLVIPKEAIADTANNALAKSDTLKFQTKKESDYGSITLRFTKLDSARHPVIQFLNGAEIVKSVKVTGTTWTDKFFNPGEFELRILYDTNNNGKWDPGNYKKKLQPEHALTLDKKLTIKANWDNEREIEL